MSSRSGRNVRVSMLRRLGRHWLLTSARKGLQRWKGQWQGYGLDIHKVPLLPQLTFLTLSFSDGLTDCEDPECCSQAACVTNQLCVSSLKPVEVLLRKQPPAITASFFERMKFLIDEGSLQNYAKMETFNERYGIGWKFYFIFRFNLMNFCWT